MASLTKKAQGLVVVYGEKGYKIAKATILDDERLTGPVVEVLQYVVEESWPNMQHPALVSLACEAVGGGRDAPDEVSAALVLLTGAADIHDDIIDKSKTKAGKLTAFGKFRKDIVLLAGDILLLKSLTQLSSATEKFSFPTRLLVRSIVEGAFVEIACATAQERLYKGDFSLEPEKYREIIFAKGSVSDAFARVGATIGGGNAEETAALGHFGRTLSVLMSLRTEFVDMTDVEELRNRAENEVLPLPILCAIQNKVVRQDLLALLKRNITTRKTEKIVELVTSTKEVEDLKREMQLLVQREENVLKTLKRNVEAFRLLLKVSVSDL